VSLSGYQRRVRRSHHRSTVARAAGPEPGRAFPLAPLAPGPLGGVRVHGPRLLRHRCRGGAGGRPRLLRDRRRARPPADLRSLLGCVRSARLLPRAWNALFARLQAHGAPSSILAASIRGGRGRTNDSSVPSGRAGTRSAPGDAGALRERLVGSASADSPGRARGCSWFGPSRRRGAPRVHRATRDAPQGEVSPPRPASRLLRGARAPLR